MGYYGFYTSAESEDAKAKLPSEGERLVFGQHRLAREDRDCKAWPRNPDYGKLAGQAYNRWIKGAQKDPRYMLAVAAGQVRRAA
jgi:hypothetical protein